MFVKLFLLPRILQKRCMGYRCNYYRERNILEKNELFLRKNCNLFHRLVVPVFISGCNVFPHKDPIYKITMCLLVYFAWVVEKTYYKRESSPYIHVERQEEKTLVEEVRKVTLVYYTHQNKKLGLESCGRPWTRVRSLMFK